MRWQRRVSFAFAASAAASGGLAFVYWTGGSAQVQGALLMLALAALGFGVVLWSRELSGHDVVEEREVLASAPGEVELMEEELGDGLDVAGRRTVLRWLLGAIGAFGVALLFPIRSLGPSPGSSLRRTAWRRGSRLVTAGGEPVRIGMLEVDGVLTVFPEGHEGSADSQALLIRVDPALFRPVPGREDWAPDGHVVYSKVCTHAGCPVGLYERNLHELLCPCHQSTFDVLHGARPVFGPAPRPLPQLPVEARSDGTLVARGDFTEPVGPGFWNRDR